MRDDFVAAYDELATGHWWWQARGRYVLKRVEQLAPAAGFGPILDVGCGTGAFLPALERFGEPQGLERDPNMAAAAPPGSRVSVGAFDPSFTPDERFGLILMLDVLEHLPNPGASLWQARDLLRSGGWLLITVPAFDLLWTRHDDVNHHFRRYTRRRLQDDLEGAGFTVRECRYFFHWAFPAKLAVAAKEMLSAPKAGAVERIPREPINSLLRLACLAEQRLFARWAPPFGSSVFALAQVAGTT